MLIAITTYCILLVLKQVNIVAIVTITIVTINDPYAKISIPNIIKNLNVKVLNLILSTNEIRHIKWHETCKRDCRLDSIVCNNKKRWNKDKCQCESKELIDIGLCDKGYAWNLSNCECECDKSCDVGEYLDYENCKYRKKDSCIIS